MKCQMQKKRREIWSDDDDDDDGITDKINTYKDTVKQWKHCFFYYYYQVRQMLNEMPHANFLNAELTSGFSFDLDSIEHLQTLH